MIIRVSDYPAKGIKIVSNGAQANGDPKEQICFDLHVGEGVRIAGDDTRRRTPNPIRLKPNDCLRIETREHLTIPNTVFGMLCSRASLTAEGLVAANLKIDPKFQGKLTITIFNASKNVITINPNLPFCSIYFATLEEPVDSESPIRTPPEAKIITGNRILEWFHRSSGHILTFVLSVLASIIASYIFGWAGPTKLPATPPHAISPPQQGSAGAAPIPIANDPSKDNTPNNKKQ